MNLKNWSRGVRAKQKSAGQRGGLILFFHRVSSDRMRVKAILFDLDGTIFDILERDAFARYKALNELGYNVSLDEIRKRYRYRKGHTDIVE
jgi:vacuolar-type H+-ATPase subunit I/STV1